MPYAVEAADNGRHRIKEHQAHPYYEHRVLLAKGLSAGESTKPTAQPELQQAAGQRYHGKAHEHAHRDMRFHYRPHRNADSQRKGDEPKVERKVRDAEHERRQARQVMADDGRDEKRKQQQREHLAHNEEKTRHEVKAMVRLYEREEPWRKDGDHEIAEDDIRHDAGQRPAELLHDDGTRRGRRAYEAEHRTLKEYLQRCAIKAEDATAIHRTELREPVGGKRTGDEEQRLNAEHGEVPAMRLHVVKADLKEGEREHEEDKARLHHV